MGKIKHLYKTFMCFATTGDPQHDHKKKAIFTQRGLSDLPY